MLGIDTARTIEAHRIFHELYSNSKEYITLHRDWPWLSRSNREGAYCTIAFTKTCCCFLRGEGGRETFLDLKILEDPTYFIQNFQGPPF